ncbi:sensor histidine kinase [Inquilinus sp. KBS0705]|nr:sensor histidine kinase [Inquilinus sp. KBS0705]
MLRIVTAILITLGVTCSNLLGQYLYDMRDSYVIPGSGIKPLMLNFEQLSANLNIILSAVIMFIALGYLYYRFYSLKKQTLLQAEIILQQEIVTKRIIAAEENERRRIAADLQDGVGQLLSTTRMNLDTLMERIKTNQPDNHLLAVNTMAIVDEGCNEVRAIAHQMMPGVLLKAGLVAALRDFLNKLESQKLKIVFETSGWDERINNNTEIVLYRVIQETVNNVIKHAGASQLDVQLIMEDDEISVTIEDNGKGFDHYAEKKFEGIGLKNMITRVEYLKGTVDISSSPGKGTLVAILIPLN